MSSKLTFNIWVLLSNGVAVRVAATVRVAEGVRVLEIVRVALAVNVGDLVAVAVNVTVATGVTLLVGVSVIVAVGSPNDIAWTDLEAFTMPGPHVVSVHALSLVSLGNGVRLLDSVKN